MSNERKTAGLSRLPVLSAAFVALVCASILGLSTVNVLSSREAEIARIETELGNLVRSLRQHAEDSFEVADAILTGVVGRLEAEGAGTASVAKLQTILDLRKPSLGRIRGLFVYDNQGRWLATTEPVNLAEFNNSDRDYFRHHRASTDSRPFIGRPVKSRSGDQWIVTVSRRINTGDGSFAGVALASIDAEYFAEFFRSFDIGKDGSVALISTDAMILARTPAGETTIGSDVSKLELFAPQMLRQASGSFQFRSPIDGRDRLSSFARSEQFPVIILVSRSQAEAMARWREDMIFRSSAVGILVLLVAATGAYLVKQLVAGRRMAAALVSSESDFRLLAEESSDLVMRIDFDGQVVYASPSCSRIVGWRPDQLVGTPALAGVNKDDLPEVERVVAELRSGTREDATLLYRTRHREKGEVWLESTMRVTRSHAAGGVDGVVAISRDRTAHKEFEDRLAALATIDGLTGLANRRAFDERLEAECARALRKGEKVSLLMIDADHFKRFNDTYGHPAGDACLKAIGACLAKFVRRPEDLAARYGGEEFALLLPGTDAAACAGIAEKVRKAIANIGIPHTGNAPSGVVTASIGTATIRPASAADGQSLVLKADAGLYEAKRQGRNRVVGSADMLPLRSHAS